ncbi:MAG: tubulin-like doman-containing protein [Vulcanimicrobiota bacterium]
MTAFFPTLVIGIGGTGKSILLDIRQRLSARFGSHRDLRTIGFLAFDTDDAIDEESSSKDPLAEALAFSAAEHVHLTVSDNKMADIRENLHSHHPAFASWLEKESLIHPSVVSGAGQIRQIGRLALLANIDKVVPAINDAVKSITSADARRSTLEYLKSTGAKDIEIREKPLRIFTTGSLIGGTGSGMFIDMGYLFREDTVRAMMAGQRPISTGIFAVPLAGRTRSGVDTRASAYAALRELNHYSDPGSRYRVDYPDGRSFESHEPPYDFTFLVSTQSGRSTLDGPRSLVSMVGRRIMLEATSEFSQKIGSNRDNIRKHLAATDDRGCNQNFFTFGLSSIEIPLRNFSTACGARFLADTIADLRYGKYREDAQNFDLDPAYLNDFLKEQRMDEAGLKKRLLEPAEGRLSLSEGFTGQLDELKELSGRPVIDRIRKLEKEIEAALTVAQGEGGKSGFAAAQIRSNARKLQSRALPILVELVERLLADPGKRLLAASAVVDSLQKKLQGMRDGMVARHSELSGRIRKGTAALKRHRRELETIAGDPLLRFSFWGGLAFKEAFNGRYARDARILWDMLFEEQLTAPDCLPAVLDSLLSKLTELNTRAKNFDLFLSNLHDDFAEKAESVAKSSIPINGKWVKSLTGMEEDNQDPVDAAYKKIIGQDLRQLTGRFIERELKDYLKSSVDETPGEETGIMSMERRGVALEELKKSLWNLATRLITQHGRLEDTDVIKAFMQEKEATELFQQVARLSTPFLELDRSDSKFDDHPGKQQTMVGFAGALGEGSSAQTRFRELCDKYIEGVEGHHDERLIPLDNSYQVIFYREYGAFPIRLWTHLKALQQAYERQLEKSRVPVHLGGKSEHYLPIIKAAREDINRLATLYMVGAIPQIAVFDAEPDSSGHRLDFTQNGLRRVLRFSSDLENTAGRLYEAEADGVPQYVDQQIAKKRSMLGDQEFTSAILEFRNSLYDQPLEEEARQYRLGLLDSYLGSDRGLTEARAAAPVQAASAGPETVAPSNPEPAQAAPTGGVSIPDQIKKLGQLRDDGILTEEEFETKKRELLDRM